MKIEEKSLPMVALRGMVIMPEMVVHFDISRERSIAALQQAMNEGQQIFMTAQKKLETENPGQEDVYELGCVGTVKQIMKMPKHILRVLVVGESRALLKEVIHILEMELADTVKAHVLQPEGTYVKVDRRGKASINSQEYFAKEAREKAKAEEPADSRVFIPEEPVS